MAIKNEAEVLRELYKAQEEELTALTEILERLKTMYEQYFAGLEKLEPLKHRTRVEQAFRKTKLTQAAKTVVRFRFGVLQQRLTTYSTYWDRVVRQIEEGTFKREGWKNFELGPLTPDRVAKGLADGKRRGDGEENESQVSERVQEMSREADDFLSGLLGGGGQTPRIERPKQPQQRPAAAASAGEGGRYRGLYQDFVSAKSASGDGAKRLSYEQFSTRIEKQEAEARKRAGQDVEFKVRVREGKVAVVAQKKKNSEDSSATS